MTLGLMQPYFFPYLGYIHMIALCDTYIVFDTSQYTPQSWMNRNRILNQHTSANTWQFVTIPINKCSQNTPFYEVTVNDKKKSYKDVLRKIEHYRKFAPYFSEVKNIIVDCFENTKTNSLVDLNVQSLKSVCKYLDIRFEPIIFSQENIVLPEIEYAGQWALEISIYYKADVYLNPPSGKAIFKEEEFIKRGIELRFMGMPDLIYPCEPYTFEPHLSIIDVLMWNSREKIQDYFRVDK